MSKIKKWLVAFTAIIAVAFSFAAIGCKKNNDVTLTYEVDGGTAIAAVSVAKGTEVELAATATKEGYEFDGWYLSSDLSGEKVTKVTVNENTSVYAKWIKLYFAAIDADGGTATPSGVYVKAGEVLLNKLEGVSVAKTDKKLGEWQVDGKAITSSYVMPERDITVKARYMTKYVVKTYLENKEGNYEEQEAVVDYAYAGTTPDKAFAEAGYELVTEKESVPVTAISDDASKNNFVLYYKRGTFTVTFEPNYPSDVAGGSADAERKTVKYGDEVAVPYDYTAEGYYLAGWSASSVAEQVDYAADYIYNKLYDKTGATAVNAKVKPSSNVVLYGVWVKGYKDMFGGKDYLFISETEENTVYMSRENYFFKGTIDGTDFRFRVPSGSLIGRILSDGLFGYSQNTSGKIYKYFVIGRGIIDGTTVKLDQYNGIEYHSDNKISNGTYTIDDNGFLIVNYTDGEFAGTTKMLYLTSATDGTDVYLERNEEEYGLGRLNTYGIINGSPAQYTLSVALNGFGYAGLYISNTYRGTYAYTLDETKGLLTINNVGAYVLTDYNGGKALFAYTASAVKTYTSADGKVTVSTDGAGRATMTDNGVASSGYYSVASSIFGGEILTYTSGNASRIFLSESVESKNEKEETVTTYTLEEKAQGYSEYYFAYNSGAYYTPLFVLNDTAVNHMTVYGRTVGGKYVKISDGTYTVTNGIYVYTRANDYTDGVITETETIEGGYRYYYTDDGGAKAVYMTTPIDFKGAAEIKFGTHIGIYPQRSGSDRTLLVSYIYSIDGNEDGFVKEYSYGDGKLTLISGIAVYDDKVSGHVYTGNYAISDDGIMTLYSGNAENYKQGGSNGKELKYIEINETDKTFVSLTSAPYSIGVFYKNGTYSATAEQITFDGKGGATYTIKSTEKDVADKVYVGKVTQNGSSLTGGQIYTFASEEKTFDYIVLTINNSYYFAMKGDYDTTLVTEDGTLTLDGFGFAARFEGTDGRYRVTSDEVNDGVRKQVIVFTDENSTYAYYFDVNGDVVTRRGTEYGSYIETDNNYFTGYYILLDGYGVAKIYTSEGIVDGKIETYVDENGTYEADKDGVYTVTFTENKVEKTVYGKLGVLVLNNTQYRNFIIVHEEKVDLYVNGQDWSMIRLDSTNGATRYSKKGIVDTGNYILITDNLIYFVNSDGSDACIYEIDTANKSAEMRTFTEFGYYTANLQSLYFTEYGYAIYNGSTRYFYTVTADNKMIIYHQPDEGEDYDASGLNKYNFIEEDFGEYDPKSLSGTHEPKAFRGETYYYNSGATIAFKRNTVADGETTKADQSYPVSGGNNVKLYATALRFRPNGKDTFSATAQMQFNGAETWYSGAVVREKVGDEYRTYFAIAAGEGVIRMYLDLTYSVNGDGESTSVFKITSLNRVVDAYSNEYLNMYAIMRSIDSMLGTNLASTVTNTNGTVRVIHDYDVNGEEIVENMKFVGNFLDGSGIKDINDRVIQVKDAAIAYDAATKIYTVEFTVPAYEKANEEETLPEHDEYKYKLYLAIGQNQYLSGYMGYSVAAFVRCQTFTTVDGYVVDVERLVYSEATTTYGGVYSLIVRKDGTDVTSATDLAITKTTEKGVELSVMVRALDEETKKITATRYYVVTLEDEVSGDVSESTTIKPFKSAAVVAKDITTVYDEKGENYVDIDGDKITLVYLGGYYAVEECSVSDGVYTAKISDTLTFTVTITDGKAQITKIESQAEEAA